MSPTHVWWWRKYRGDRKGQPCELVASARGPGPRNVAVRFADGEVIIAPRWAIRRTAAP